MTLGQGPRGHARRDASLANARVLPVFALILLAIKSAEGLCVFAIYAVLC
jgi:hypothetical protein